MSNLFKKVAVLTDLHIGLKSNSLIHNEDCLNFVTWFCAKARSEGCDTCIMTGDWHNNRASINIVSLDYSRRCIELLSENFDQVFFIPGNHDLYYRDKRDITSVAWAKHLPNVTIISDFIKTGDVIFAPWLVGDDAKKIPKMSGEYMFGHFELPGYLMNAMVQMPDHGEINTAAFGKIGHVYTGHFHKRQIARHGSNVTYSGNCFPHNYADAGDDDRGMMIIAWGMPPEFHAWPDQPRYRVYNLSDVLQHTETMLQPGMHVRVNIDVDLSYEEAAYVKETFVGTYGLREMTLIPSKMQDLDAAVLKGNVGFQSVDQIVTNQLNVLESETFDKNILLDIYRNL
jgi:hypothetical protein